MSSPDPTSHLSSTRPAEQDTVPQGHYEPKQDPVKADVVHHLYFEDNDSFFPPSWLGKDTAPSERRSPNHSTSHDPKN
ncbi:uncharacterized protein N7482_002281 [Penicillium canariense]|uniref:Uncharacterized protein n=1 Tax=Penicillium canariense TaxID=189055 RepID=A0A9W9LUP3_9EURO|nr:uncharacterized protein N7482_002281 [Penicillium canariense]KAJ5176404.1 hypothetical protein N7482_002281 [Penicillium canariense]